MNTEDNELPALPGPEAGFEVPQIDQLPLESPPDATPVPWENGVGSVFANQADLDRYQRAIMNGASEREALKVGDNGVGKWDDVTSTYKIPMVAFPRGTPGAEHNRLVELMGPKGSVVARVGDEMEPGLHANIDLNPAAASAVGHPGGLVPIKWRFAQGDGASQLAGAQSNSSPGDLTPIGSQSKHVYGQDSYADISHLEQWLGGLHAVKKDEHGVVTLSDGTTKVYGDGSVVFDRGGQQFMYTPNGQVKPIKSTAKTGAPHKTDLDIFKETAAKQGVVFSEYPQTEEGKQKFMADAKLAIGKGTDPDAIAESIVNGDSPPTLTGLYGKSGAVRTSLEKKYGYNLKNAQLDFEAARAFVRTQNSPNFIKFRAAMTAVEQSLDKIDQLASEWKAGRFPPLNRARLEAAKNFGLGGLSDEDAKKAASVATQLEGQITDMTAGLGQVYLGGGSPTDQSLKLAEKNLNAAWDETVLHDMVNLARGNLRIRRNSLVNLPVVGAPGASPAATPTSSATPTPPATPSGTPTASIAAPPQYRATNPEEYAKVPAGQRYIDADGNVRRKAE